MPGSIVEGEGYGPQATLSGRTALASATALCLCHAQPKMRTTRKVYAQLRLAANSTSLDALVVANASFTAGYYRRLVCLRRPHTARKLRPLSPQKATPVCSGTRPRPR